MKKVLSLMFLLFSTFLMAQVPQGINYQAIVRDGSGVPITTGPITVDVTISNGSGNFTETHNETPNQFGLVNFIIGSINSAAFKAFDFSVMPTTISVDAAGNNLGIQTLQSVPYSLNAAITDSVKGVDLNTLETITAGPGLIKVGSAISLGGVMEANTTLSSADDMFFDGTGGGVIYFENGEVEVSSQLRIQDGNQAIGKVLTSDAIGNATWEVPAAETDPQVGSLTTNYIPRWSSTSLVNSRIIDNGFGVSIGKGLATSYGLEVQSTSGVVSRFTGSNTYTAFELNTTVGNYAYYRFLNNGAIAGGLAYYLNSIRMYQGSALSEGITLTSTSDVGIGVIAPVNKLDVEGEVAIGTAFSGTSAAPVNGLLVEGKVGIGTATMGSEKLKVSGGDFVLEDTYPFIFLRSTGTFNDGIYFQHGTSTKASITYIGSTNKLHIGSGTGGTSDMVFDATNGRLGLGTSSPATSFHFLHSTGGPSSGDGFTIENEGANDNRWNFYVQNVSGEMWLYKNELYRGKFDDVTGAYSSTSDGRLKKDIEPLGSVLTDLLSIPTYNYRYKQENEASPKRIGLIAQDLVEKFPSLVDYNEEGDVYTLDYARVSVVVLKAIQEQQIIIDELKKEIELLKK